MKNASVNSLVDDMVEERITEVEDTRMSVETSKWKTKEKDRKKTQNTQELWHYYKRCMYV